MANQESYSINTTPYQNIYISNGDAVISMYKQTQKPKHTLVLFPGFAKTVETHQLLTKVFMWGLNNKYNVVITKTPINNIDLLNQKINLNYKYPELQALYNKCMQEIQIATNDNKIHIVAHSGATTLLTTYFNDCIKTGLQPPIGSAIFFAPYPTNPVIFDTLMKHADKTDNQNTKTKLHNIIPFLQFVIDSTNQIDPTFMSQYTFPIHLICGKADKNVSINNILTKFIIPAANKNISLIVVPGGHNLNTNTYDLPMKILTQQNEH